jgi:hypothetical protein
MNSYLWIRRARGPVILLVVGITALLDQWGIISFGRSWPLYLIVLGVMQLAERAAWSQMQQNQQAQYAQGQYPPYGAAPGQAPGPYQGPYQGPYSGPTPPPGSSSTSLTITPHDSEGR